jgi:hypothetical protein
MSIIRMIKPKRMRLEGYIPCMGRRRMNQGFGGKTRRKESSRKT